MASILTVAARIRKNTEARVFLLEALAVFWSFTFAAFRPGQASWLDDPWVLLRAAIPAAAAMATLLLRDTQASADDAVQWASTLDVLLAYAAAFLTQPVVHLVWPWLALPRWAPTEGGIVGPLFLMFVRALFPPRARRSEDEAGTGPPASVAEIRWRVEEFAREIRVRNMVLCAAAAVLALVAVRFVLTGAGRTRASFGITLLGLAYAVWQFVAWGLPRKVPSGGSLEEYCAFYRTELTRQLVFHDRIGHSFYEALVPGAALLIFGTRIYHFVLVLVVLLIAELNHRTAVRLERQVNEAIFREVRAVRR